MSIQKHRYWWFILYPESAPPDWKDILKFRGLPCAISPLHEFDIKDYETGELKKAHHHIILAYSGPTTFQNVKRLTVDELNSTIPKPLDCIRPPYEYLTHKNDPDKHQYSADEIEHINGFDLSDMIELDAKDKASIVMSIHHDIKQNNIYEHWQLLDYYEKIGDYTRFNFVFSHTIHFNRYIASRRHSSVKSDEEYIEEFNERR